MTRAADRLAKRRAHRIAFQLALAEGLTLAEATRRLKRLEVRAVDAVRSLDTRDAPVRTADRWDAPWMMRD